MPRPIRPNPHTAHRPSASLVRALLLARWLLVLVLAWDQIASPLHRHHHDSGIDASWISAAQEEAGASVLHVDGDDHGSEFAHATLAVQLQAQTGQLSGASEPYALFFAFAEVFDPVTSPVAQASTRASSSVVASSKSSSVERRKASCVGSDRP